MPAKLDEIKFNCRRSEVEILSKYDPTNKNLTKHRCIEILNSSGANLPAAGAGAHMGR